MDHYAARLPVLLGSAAALVTAWISFVAQVSPIACVMRAVAAFVLFAAFGIVIRYIVGSAQYSMDRPYDRAGEPPAIPPGTSVEEWLAAQDAGGGSDDAGV